MRCPEIAKETMKITGENSKDFKGVQRLGGGRYRVRGKFRNPKTGRWKEFDRTIEARDVKAAAKVAAEIRRTVLEELDGGGRAARPLVRDAATLWLRGKLPSLKASTRALYGLVLDAHIVPAFGDHYVDAVTKADVIAWRDRQVGATATINGRLRVLRTLFADLSDEMQIPNPTARVAAFRDVRSMENAKVIPPAEIAELLTSLRTVAPQWYPLVLTLATTGARCGEATALLWEDVDLEAGIIHIRRAHYSGTVDTTKTGKSRSVPIAPELVAVLQEHRRTLMRRQAAGFSAGLVFPSRTGGLIRPGAIRKPVQAALDAIGSKRHVSAHCFRHSFNDAFRRIASGEVTRSMTGHSSEKMTTHYSTVTRDDQRAAVDTFAAAFFPKVGIQVGTGSNDLDRVTEKS